MADISIHTTTQVVTGMLYAFHGFLCYFNPHHHAGGDPMGGMMPGMSGDFNPHHHAGGDKPQTITRLSSWNFNPHHHAGGDRLCRCGTQRDMDFNPHHHAGGDRILSINTVATNHFNPHHHAGGDQISQKINLRLLISIHTTTQVVTLTQSPQLIRLMISIHTTTQVVTYNTYRFHCSYPYFNPHHHAGGDLFSRRLTGLQGLFQSTPPRRW